jgi:Rieske Fe-S protein
MGQHQRRGGDDEPRDERAGVVDGIVVRGPAPLPLKIVKVAVIDNSILLSPWTETDPRTGEKPWWI